MIRMASRTAAKLCSIAMAVALFPSNARDDVQGDRRPIGVDRSSRCISQFERALVAEDPAMPIYGQGVWQSSKLFRTSGSKLSPLNARIPISTSLMFTIRFGVHVEPSMSNATKVLDGTAGA